MRLDEKVKKIVEEVIALFDNVELVDLKIIDQGGSRLVKVFAQTKGGILLAECVKINKSIRRRVEEDDGLRLKYKIEVSSPGMDRLLKSKLDFERVCGKQINLTTIEPVLNDSVVVGILKSVDSDKIIIEVSKDNQIKVNLDNINQARLEIRW